MTAYTMTYEVRWTDIDANRHMRSSAYIDAAEELRYRFFIQHDLTPEYFDKLTIGPVYTALSVNFYREIRLSETITITYLLTGLSERGMHWRVRHEFLKANGKKAVTLVLEGTILDLGTRQPTVPTPEIMAVFQRIPRSSDFEVLPESRWFNPSAISSLL